MAARKGWGAPWGWAGIMQKGEGKREETVPWSQCGGGQGRAAELGFTAAVPGAAVAKG